MTRAEVARTGRSTGNVVMVDVAKAAGVSQKTVSRVINGSEQVRPEVRDRVLAVIGQLGYRRNGAAAALAAGRTHVIGIVAMGSPLFGIAQHVIGVEREARKRGYGTVMVTVEEAALPAVGPGTASNPGIGVALQPDGRSLGLNSPETVHPAIDRALALGAEGIVLVEPFAREASDFAAYADIPMVSPQHTSSPQPEASPAHSHVTAAEYDGARLATAHLLQAGHTHVAHIAGPTSWRPAVLRELAWRQTLSEHGLPVPRPVRGDWSARSGYEAARRLLARGDGFTALFAGNDAMAIGAMRAFAEAGLRIPADVAVVGFDDLPESEFQMVPLTSVRQDFDEIARLSVEAVIAALDGRSPQPQSLIVPARLMARDSSAGRATGGAAST